MSRILFKSDIWCIITSLCVSGHSISEELNDCMSNGMTQLEMERDELQHDLEDTKQRLANTQRELDSLKKTMTDLGDSNKQLAEAKREVDSLKKTVADLDDSKTRLSETQREIDTLKKALSDMKHLTVKETQSNEMLLDTEKVRKQTPEDPTWQKKQEAFMQKLNADFELRICQVKSDHEAERKSLKEEYDRTVSNFNKEREALTHEIERYKESWQSEKDNYTKLESLNKDLISEKYQCKTTIEAIRKNSETCIKELEKEVQALQIQADNAASLTETGECSACRRESNQERVEDVMSEIERQYPHLIYTENQPPLSRSRPSSGRFKHGESTPTNSNVSRSMQCLPVQVSYVEGPEVNSVTPQRREMSSSTMSMNKNNADIMRPHPLRRSPRPASVMGLTGEQLNQRTSGGHATPRRSQHAQSVSPQRRFIRGEKARSTVIGRNSNKPIPTMETFSRSDRKRMTMPEKRSAYVHHSVKPSTPKESSSTSSHTLVTQDTLYLQQAFLSQHGTPVSSTTPSRIYHGSNHDHEAHITRVSQHRNDKSNGYNSDRDSGFATSPNSPESSGDSTTRDHFVNFSTINAETLRNSFKTSGKVSEKWKVFVDKIVELQDKNQQLTSDNAEMKKRHNAVKFNEERISHIEKKNLELELENKKLRKIVESLQSQLSAGNPYDPREYHFYTNV